MSAKTATRGARQQLLPSSERVYRSLRERIVAGDLAPGTRLVELPVALEFGVSRTPVREAVKRLEAEGLVRVEPGRGMVVHSPEGVDIDEVFVVRGALDGLAARLAAYRITPAELARLQVITDSIGEAALAGRWDHVIVANSRFHELIYTIAGNGLLTRLGRDVRDSVRRLSPLRLSDPDRIEYILQGHQTVLDALATHDPVAAERASKGAVDRSHQEAIRLQLQEFTDGARS